MKKLYVQICREYFLNDLTQEQVAALNRVSPERVRLTIKDYGGEVLMKLLGKDVIVNIVKDKHASPKLPQKTREFIRRVYRDLGEEKEEKIYDLRCDYCKATYRGKIGDKHC